MNKEIQLSGEKLLRAVADIKEAILQGQYEACKGVNRIQLAVYFGIGKYISQHTRKGVWGTGALETISEQLRRELPGLRGYSATQMKDMRLFYEAWSMLDANSSVATDKSICPLLLTEFVSVHPYRAKLCGVAQAYPLLWYRWPLPSGA